MSLKFLCLSIFVHISSGQSTVPVIAKQQPPHCDSANKNSLIEHFFNIIFSEFYATPPVCACIQMCAGDATYCYPNGCLKGANTVREDNSKVNTNAVLPTQAIVPMQMPVPKKQYMLVSDDKFDFMTDFLERNYVEESQVTPHLLSAQDIRPDPFKDKFNVLGKLKRRPKVELRYNIRDQVKNSKSDLVKNEGVDLTKTRWPLKQLRNRMNSEDKADLGKTNFFTKMLVESNVVEYLPKYFKRDVTKTPMDDEEDYQKTSNLSKKLLNKTDYSNFSLESFIDTLIKNSIVNNVDTTNFDKADESEADTNFASEMENNFNFTNNSSDATKVISMNLTDENVDKNKYTDDSSKNKTKSIKEMITHLEKEIESQNNTSMEIAKRVVGGYVEPTPYSDLKKEEFNKSDVLQATYNYSTAPAIYQGAEITTSKEFQGTKKNRQRFVRKLSSSKNN